MVFIARVDDVDRGKILRVRYGVAIATGCEDTWWAGCHRYYAAVANISIKYNVKGRERYLLPPARLYERRFRSAKTQKHICVAPRS